MVRLTILMAALTSLHMLFPPRLSGMAHSNILMPISLLQVAGATGHRHLHKAKVLGTISLVGLATTVEGYRFKVRDMAFDGGARRDASADQTNLKNLKAAVARRQDKDSYNQTASVSVASLNSSSERSGLASSGGLQALWKLYKFVGPGTKIDIDIPVALQDKPLREINLVHRKPEKHWGSVYANSDEKPYPEFKVKWKGSGDYWDEEGAYNLVLVHEKSTSKWWMWMNGFSDTKVGKGGKFAEPDRGKWWEQETLYDWVVHRADSKTFEKQKPGVICIDRISIIGTGEGENAVSEVKELGIKFFPRSKSDPPSYPPGPVIEHIFTPRTAFQDFSRSKWVPQYGGGEVKRRRLAEAATDGPYPHALRLGSGKVGEEGFEERLEPIHKVTSDFKVDDNTLEIPLPAGRILLGAEFAVGDTYLKCCPASVEDVKAQRNKDGHYGQLGWAKVSAKISSSREVLIDRANVPPQAVVSGFTDAPNGYVIPANDLLQFKAHDYPVWLMGYRILLASPSTTRTTTASAPPSKKHHESRHNSPSKTSNDHGSSPKHHGPSSKHHSSSPKHHGSSSTWGKQKG